MSRSLQITHVDPKLLKESGWNVNIVSPDNEAKIKNSLDRFGFFKPILVRETPAGLQIIGGEHRWAVALREGYDEVPVINLGAIDDTQAKEISLVDNGRFGHDDILQLGELLSSIGDISDLQTFLPYESGELESMFSSVSIALDDLELGEEDEKPPVLPAAKPAQEFQMMRFKVPVGDAEMVQKRIDKIMKTQKFTEEDSLTNAGHALVHLCQET